MSIGKFFANAALTALKGIGAWQIPAVPLSTQEESMNRTYGAFAIDVGDDVPTLDD